MYMMILLQVTNKNTEFSLSKLYSHYLTDPYKGKMHEKIHSCRFFDSF
jgi:hypothetical protein